MNSIGHNETYSELRRLRMILSRTRTYEGTIKWSIIEIWTQKVQLERFSVFFKIKKKLGQGRGWLGCGRLPFISFRGLIQLFVLLALLCLVSTIPLPFCHCLFAVAISLCCAVAVLPFRSYHCHCGWERKCWKHLSVYIGIKWPER